MANPSIQTGRRLAFISVAGSSLLAVGNVTAGLLSGSTSVTAAGLEFAGDVLASLIVYFGMLLASKPPDADHPYGHGRFEILSGLLVGLILILAGVGISWHSIRRLSDSGAPPLASAVWAPLVSMVVKGGLALSKFRVGRNIGSSALIADAWNDTVDILSAFTAMAALSLALYDPQRFALADPCGGFAVGVIVVVTGLRVVRDSSLELTDTMPTPALLEEIRRYACEIAQVDAVEKCYARKTGLQYQVDLHIEVDPQLTVADSHFIAHEVQQHIVDNVPSVAGVLVHVEPRPAGRTARNESNQRL